LDAAVTEPFRPALVAFAALAALLGACTGADAPVRTLAFEGPEDGELLNAEDLEGLLIQVIASTDGGMPPELDDLRIELDGEDRTHEAERDTDRLRWAPGQLDDGDRTIRVVSRPLPTEEAPASGEQPQAAEGEAAEPELLHSWTVTVDTTPPTIEITSPVGAVVAGDPMTVTGTTEPAATVRIGGTEVVAGADGAFELLIEAAPEAPLEVVAIDLAGNESTEELLLVTVPSRVESDEIRTVHVSFYGWVSRLKAPILQMIEDGRINAVQLDLKDEAGQIAYDSQVPLAQEMGATMGIWDLREAVAELHELGVPVVGRIVAFADPILARWAWDNDRRDWVIQTADGELYVGRYAGFANFDHADVRDYNIAVAEEAARAGVDHILWDYIRRPDGSLSNMRIPGLVGPPEDSIVEFTRLADERLAPYGVQHGASVYGIAADRPTEIGQYIPGMADHLDYVAPMIYPSHWGPGEYGVADPNRQPYDIVTATLAIWQKVTADKRARVVPWLEDTTYRAWDRPLQVREQIRATRDAGIDEWLMWDPLVNYTVDAYERRS